MSDSADYAQLSAPVQYGQRRATSRINAKDAGQTGRNKHARPMVGGDVVGSMKRGIKDHSGDLKRRESRLLVLYSIAGALFCVLTAIWVKKLYGHWNNWSKA